MSKSRLEILLEALRNGETPDVTPLSRAEVYLLALCEKGVGGDGVSTSGDVMTGDLVLGATDSTNTVQLKLKKLGSDSTKREVVHYISGGNMARIDLMSDGKVINFLQLGPTETGLSKPLRVSSGGTGVTSLAELKTALGIDTLESRVSALES